MKNQTLTTAKSFWVTSLILSLFTFTIQAQDCFFETSYDVIEVANNGDGTCDYMIDLCAFVDNNAVLHSIEYSVMYDSDGDGDAETMVQHNFNPGIQIPTGNYCLSSSAPTQTFSISTPCGTDMMIVITGTNAATNEDCINLIEDVAPVFDPSNELEEMAETAELVLPDNNNNKINNNESSILNTYYTTPNNLIYPTLVQNVVNFNVPEASQEVIQIMISDLSGNVVVDTTLEPGSIGKQIAVDQLQTGQYWLVAQSKTLKWTPQAFMKAGR